MGSMSISKWELWSKPGSVIMHNTQNTKQGFCIKGIHNDNDLAGCK